MNTSRYWRFYLFALILFLLPFLNLSNTPTVLAQDELGLTKFIPGGQTTVEVGETFEYRLQYSCNSLTGPCGALQVTDTLPPYLTIVGIDVAPGYTVVTTSPTPGVDSGTVTITHPDFQDGSQSEAVITVRVNYDAPGGDTLSNTATGTIASPATTVNTPPVEVIINPPTVQWDLEKTQVLPVPPVEPALNNEVTYQISFCSASAVGNVSLFDVTVTDLFPTGAVVVNAGGGVVDNANSTITWDLGDLDISTIGNGCVNRYVVLTYPSPPFAQGTPVTNRVSATALDPDGNVVGFPPVGSTHDFDPANGTPSAGKTGPSQDVGLTGTGRFFLSMNTNSANVRVQNAEVLDTIPAELRVTGIGSGTWTPSYVQATVSYFSTAAGAFTTLGTVDGDDNTVWTAGLPTDITQVRWQFSYTDPYDGLNYTGIPLGFSTNNLEIIFTPRPSAVAGSTYQNCAETTWGSPSLDVTNCANVRIADDTSNVNVQPSKTRVNGSGQLDPNDTIQFETRLTLTERSSAPLIDPSIVDIIPTELEFVSYDGLFTSGLTPAEETSVNNLVNFQTLSNFPTAGQTSLRWTWNGVTIAPPATGSKDIYVRFTMRVRPGTLANTYSNTGRFLTDSPGLLCEGGAQPTDPQDLDSDGTTSEVVCNNTVSYQIRQAAVMTSEKWIANPPFANVDSTDLNDPAPTCPDDGTGGGFTRFPCVAQGYPDNPGTDDEFEYKMVMRNEGNVLISNYIMYDILPYVGDTGSGGPLVTTPRQSEFQPVLISAVTPTALPGGLDVTIEYSGSSNPCRTEVFVDDGSNNEPAGCTDDWSATPPGGLFENVRAIRIFFSNGTETIAPLQAMEFRAQMRIPATAQSGQIAWNSFAQRLTNAVTAERLPTSEPRKVGIIVPERLSIGNRVWYDIDNSRTINAADGATPGLAGVMVSLYRDNNNDGSPDGAAIATDVTDANGYYLFSDLDAGRYLVGIDNSNFTAGNPLQNLVSSTGNSGDNQTDNNDNGRDTADPTYGILSPSILLGINAEPTNDTDVSNAPADGPFYRGTRGEADNNSDLSVDFGFYQPMSLGNRVWLDEGAGGGLRNNGIQDGTEPGISGVRVELFLDADNDSIADAGEFVTFDTTDANGYYLFDALGEGRYLVVIPASNFNMGAPLEFYASSTGNAGDNQIDRDDNGIDANNFASAGIRTPQIVLTRTVEPTGETDLSNNPADGAAGSRGNQNQLDNNSDLTVDFGFYEPKMSLGNRVWYDPNNNAVQDAGETGLPNVTVTLHADANNDGTPDGAALATDVTDANGYYLFDNLRAGRYIVAISNSNFATGQALDEMFNSTSTAPNPVASDSQTDLNDNGRDTVNATYGVLSSSILLQLRQEPTGEAVSGNPADGPSGWGNQAQVDNDSELTVDFGFYKTMSLGNRVWLDDGNGSGVRNNGLRDGTEAGIAGVSVSLFVDADANGTPDTPASPVATTTTDSNGYYLFDRLMPGGYVVSIDASNFTGVLTGLNSSPGNTGDNQTDINDNGIDSENPATTGVLSPTITLTLDSEPSGESDTSGNAAAHGPNSRGRFNESDDNSDLTIDFGFDVPPMSIGNRVWFDLNNNGLLDGGEAGVNGVTVVLFPDGDGDGIPDGSSLATDTTDANGYYLFDNLRPGTYLVQVAETNFQVGNVLAEYTSSTGDTTDTDNNDNGRDEVDPPANGVYSNPIILTVNGEVLTEADLSNNGGDGPNFRGNNGELNSNSDLTVDFGFYRALSLGNRVWLDNGAGGGTRNDGVQQNGESGIGGVTVVLEQDNGGTWNVLATDVTDGNGYYLFDGLQPGTYRVSVANVNFTTGNPLVGLNSSSPSFADDVDRNDNGINEELPATNGVYSNAVVLAFDAEPTGEADLSGNPADGPASRGRFNESDDSSDLTIDFGFVQPPMSIGNRVWFDLNNNGLLDGGETGGSGVRVVLFPDGDGDGIPDGSSLATDTTDANGYYLFDNLRPGTYLVWVDELNFRTGGVLIDYYSSTGNTTTDTDQNDNGLDDLSPDVGGIFSNPITLTVNGEVLTEADLSNNGGDGPNFRGNTGELNSNSDLTVDFGFYKPMSIGNRVWFDTDNSGTINGLENGIGGVVVELYVDTNNDNVPDTLVDTDTTDANGYYLFDGLIPGTYRVTVVGANFGTVLNGLSSSTGNTTTDTDSNDNGVDDADPATNGISSNVFTLTFDTEPINEADRSLNPADGPNFIGNNGETDRNSDLTIDFGFFAGTNSIGNRVWLDANNSGTVDGTDGATPGLAGVVVSLYRDVNNDGLPDGAAIATDTTNASGYYLFDGLPPGNYLVGLNNSNFVGAGPLVGLLSSTGNTADDTDSNDNGRDGLNVTYGLLSNTINLATNAQPTGETDLSSDPADGPTFIGNNGETDQSSDVTVDFGLYRPMSLGNRLWFDNNNNGVREISENGVPGATVTLYTDPEGDGVPNAPVNTVTTDANGYYLFDGLTPGSYVVVVDAANFQAGGVLQGLSSSTGNNTNNADGNDNGIDNATATINGVLSNPITLTLNNAPTAESDLSGNPAQHGPNSRGRNGETDNNSNLTVDFGFVGATMSLGNRVWLDMGAGAAFNNGLLDGGETGLANVVVSLYADSDNNGLPDGAALATDTTNANGYYLFGNLTPGRYIVGLNSSNFTGAGVLVGLTSSTGNTATDVDSNDNGIDDPNVTLNGLRSNSILLTLGTEPAGETDLSNDPADGAPGYRGTNGEADNSSDLTIDFGLYQAMSVGNRVWFDGNNNGVQEASEPGAANVTVAIYQDADSNGMPDGVAIATETTDANGFYLFDGLPAGNYVIGIPSTNFQPGGVLQGLNSSTGNTVDNADRNDNGVDAADPATNGIFSNTLTLTYNSAPTGETDTSGNVLRDGPNFRGRFGETDSNSNLTVDFGFVSSPMSIGNRVWRDDGAGGGVANNGIRDGSELGIANVTVNLYRDNDGNGVPDGAAIGTDTTDTNGFYLFDNLSPGQYVVRIAPSNFASGAPLYALFSSPGSTLDTDSHDNGLDTATAATQGVFSPSLTLTTNTEPAGETDLSANPGDGPNSRGNNGETDPNSNLTVDFGFGVVYDLGDNPDNGTDGSYNTVYANNGASHRIIPDLYLGAIVDADADGQPNVGANGDDTGASDDEDGVTIPTLVVGTTVNIEVTVYNNTGSPATLTAWIDFDENGGAANFDPVDQIAAIVVPSSNQPQIIQVPITVPIGADVVTGGTSYARFRLTTDGTVPPTGTASNGEVEDYPVTILPPGLSITKTDSRNSIVVGQATTYTITITNSGLDALGRQFIDNIPTGDPDGFDLATITWICTATSGASCIAGAPANTGANGTGTINAFIDVPRNGVIVYQLTGTLRVNYSQPTVTNTGEVVPGLTATDVNGVIFDPPTGTKIGVVLDDTLIRWTMTWINTGGAQAATVSDTLEPDQTFAGNLVCTPFGSSTTIDCSFNNGVVSWSGIIDTGTANRVDIAFDVTVPGDGVYTNTGTIDIGGETDSATSTVRVGEPPVPPTPTPIPGEAAPASSLLDPLITKSVVPTAIAPGETAIWTIQVNNPNSTALTDVTVTDVLTDGLEIVKTEATAGIVSASGQTITLLVRTLEAGQTITLTITTRAKVGGLYTNTALLNAPYRGSASAQLIVATRLPDTGETPARWLSSVLSVMVSLVILLSIVCCYRLKGRATRL